MSSGGDGKNPTGKLQSKDSQEPAGAGANAAASAQDPIKQAVQLEEDDEFEDFPVEDWPDEETEAASGNTHLWDESWDDDDENEDFSKVLKEELQKVRQGK